MRQTGDQHFYYYDHDDNGDHNLDDHNLDDYGHDECHHCDYASDW